MTGCCFIPSSRKQDASAFIPGPFPNGIGPVAVSDALLFAARRHEHEKYRPHKAEEGSDMIPVKFLT